MTKKKTEDLTPDQQGMWTAMRRCKTFTVVGLAQATGARNPAVKSLLWLLVRTGYVTAARTGTYVLVRDTGPDLPDIAADAAPPTGAERMWAAMKVLKIFTVLDLSFPAEVTPKAARSYCSYLCKAQYLRHNAKSGRAQEIVYTFNPRMNTGFKAPQVRRRKNGRVVFDPNLGRIVWPESEAA
ncbi:MAG: hypothetical protein GC185_01735 [Alphaproteobacteria bacterium]|nr:hypothetical protein [Alphaproteobacteria bacterium]